MVHFKPQNKYQNHLARTDHLKRYHYNGNAPSEIQHSHAWDDWYRFIAKDTDRETRAIPNSGESMHVIISQSYGHSALDTANGAIYFGTDPNFVRILCYLLRASEQLEGQEAPCFGTRILKLLQHAQRYPTESEHIIRGLAAILDRPYDPVSTENENFATEIPSVPLSLQNHLSNPGLQYASESVFSRLHWPSEGVGASAHAQLESTIPNPAQANSFNAENNDLEPNQYLVLAAAPACTEPPHGAEVWQLTPIVAHSTTADTTDDIGEWVRSSDYTFDPNNFNEAMEEIAISQDVSCQEVQARVHSKMQVQLAFPIRGLEDSIQASSGFVDPKQTQIPKIDSLHCTSEHPDGPLSIMSPSELFAKTRLSGSDVIPAPTFVQPQRRLKDGPGVAKRKRPRAESVGNILIPTYDNRFNPLPTPSPSVLSKAGSSLMTPSLLTPFTANTTCSSSSFSVSTHMILVISGRRPEMFTFSGSISNSIDGFIDWVSRTFSFDFADVNRGFWFMNDIDIDSVPLYNKDAVLAQLEDFWDGSGDTFFNKAIPWFWIDMPCRCFIMNPNLSADY
ncbi:hypothetical protein ABW20_dc0100228 [Dactylellina cionopaga]|nr:hypothetical protein ABW20_dc0100228 [Dactylellina cionopaga]